MYNLGGVKMQTVMPVIPRRGYAIGETIQLVWLDDGDTIRVVPIPSDPLRPLRGRGRGEGLAEKLLIERQQDGMQR